MCHYFIYGLYFVYTCVFTCLIYMCVSTNFCCYNECTELPMAKHGFSIKISVSGNYSDHAAVCGLLN